MPRWLALFTLPHAVQYFSSDIEIAALPMFKVRQYLPLSPIRGSADFEGVLALFINALDEEVFTTSGGASERGGCDFWRRLRRQLQPELLDQQSELALGLGVSR